MANFQGESISWQRRQDMSYYEKWKDSKRGVGIKFVRLVIFKRQDLLSHESLHMAAANN